MNGEADFVRVNIMYCAENKVLGMPCSNNKLLKIFQLLIFVHFIVLIAFVYVIIVCVPSICTFTCTN